MRKLIQIVLLLTLGLVAGCAMPAAGPEAAATEAPQEEAAEPATEAMDAEMSVCGTDEEVTITYVGDPAGTHPDAEGSHHRTLPGDMSEHHRGTASPAMPTFRTCCPSTSPLLRPKAPTSMSFASTSSGPVCSLNTCST